MKKLLLGSLVGLALAGSASASVVTLDFSKVDGANGSIEFDMIDFVPFSPTSFYVDQTENGFVDNGEFVFDFGLGLEIGTLQLGDQNTAVGNGAIANYRLIADYLLTGSAIVSDSRALAFLQGSADFEGLPLEQYINFVLAETQGCTNPGIYGRDCQSIERINSETVLDGSSADEILAANLTDGIFNLFLADTDFNRVGLAGSFAVSSTGIQFGNEVNLSVTGTLIQAEDGILFDQFGNSFAEILDDVNLLPPSLTFKTTIQDSSRLAGTEQSSQIGTSNPAGVAFEGETNEQQLYYYTGNGLNARNVYQEANLCPNKGGTNPDDIAFGGCSSIIGNNGAADKLWDTLKASIGAAAGCAKGEGCAFDLLARTTDLDGNAVIEATAPGSLMVGGLGLLMLGLRRKFF